MLKSKLKQKSLKVKVDGVFEVAWEAGHKVGGIYTVLASKAFQAVTHFPKNYYLVGPYLKEKTSGEFKQEDPPACLKKAFEGLIQKQGIVCHFGRWLVKGEPKIILLDFTEARKRVNQFKEQLWYDFQIDSWGAGDDFNEPVAFSEAAGQLLEEISRLMPGKKIVAHFHEWLSAGALLYLKKRNIKWALVFTTHGTTLGRTLAFHNVEFYSFLSLLMPEEEVLKYNIKAKHQLERAAALNSDVFTTVSEMTAIEADKFLGRLPEVILANGLDSIALPSFEELTLKHRLQRGRLRQFLLFYFFPFYTFDIEKTLFYFISGRHEVKAKGIDIFIKALSLLNNSLKQAKSKKTIIAFFWVPAEVKAVMPQILESKELFKDIKDYLEEVDPEVDEKLLASLVQGKKFGQHDLFSKGFLFEIKKKLLKLKREGLPPLSTHQLAENSGLIIQLFLEAGLSNKPSDRVKVIFYPAYLNGHDGLLNLDYEEAVQACHLGVFPSCYEPWGYTPLETAASAVPSVTTDLAGFGRFCQENAGAGKYPGVFVLKRQNRSDKEAAHDLYQILRRFSYLTRKERVENKIQARKIADLVDWSGLYKNYIKAYNLALSKL